MTMDLNAFVCNLQKPTTDILKTTIVDLDSDLEGAQCDPSVLEAYVAAFLAEEAQLGASRCFISTQRVVSDNFDGVSKHWRPDGVYAVLTFQFAVSSDVAHAGVERILQPIDLKGRRAASFLAEFAAKCGGLVTLQIISSSNATWRIYLRTLSDRAEVLDAEEMPVTATVLLVEDEEFVRSVTREVLELSGYRVLEARNAEEGFQIFDKHHTQLDLVLTDVVMPGMNGPQLVRRLSALAPGLRVIFMSGYTDNEVVRRGLGDPNIAYLQKPFTVDALARKVQEVLSAPPSQPLPLTPADLVPFRC